MLVSSFHLYFPLSNVTPRKKHLWSKRQDSSCTRSLVRLLHTNSVSKIGPRLRAPLINSKRYFKLQPLNQTISRGDQLGKPCPSARRWDFSSVESSNYRKSDQSHLDPQIANHGDKAFWGSGIRN
jgi:hypothetical protein